MSSNRQATFRLLGEHDGSPLSFVLAAGEHVLGTDPTCDVVVPIRGVSRRHARLEVSSAGVRITDLGSKNGSFVGERPGDGELALIGDVLRFGPVDLRLAGGDPEEAVLGLSLDPLSGLLQQDPSLETTWMPGGDAGGASGLGALEAVLGHLESRPESRPENHPESDTPADLGGALRALHRSSGGAALVHWPRQGREIVLASSGRLGSVPPRPEGGSGGPWRAGPLPDGDGRLVWRRHGAAVEGLVIWGESELDRPWLIVFARLLFQFTPEIAPQGRNRDAPRPSRLELPGDVVRGRSPAMEALYQQMALLLESDVPVLILGETGTGKEHLAQALHENGPRRSGPFVAVNCAAIPQELLEAEMFGIGRGVATGVEARRGKFSEARGGTLFLDEVGDMPAALQAKLLRALQEGEIHPLGRAAEKTDVRVLAATNSDLDRRMREDLFRRDLYYRLAGFVLEVPPLRRRREDLPSLAGHFLQRFSREARKPIRGMTLKALRKLGEHGWPGNIRELEHTIRRLVFLCPPHQAIDGELVASQVDSQVASQVADEAPRPEAAAEKKLAGEESAEEPTATTATTDDHALPEHGLDAHLREIEKACITRALRRTAGNQSAAARLLQVSRNGLAKRIKRLDIDVARFLP